VNVRALSQSPVVTNKRIKCDRSVRRAAGGGKLVTLNARDFYKHQLLITSNAIYRYCINYREV
jgi:hypothetical protein